MKKSKNMITMILLHGTLLLYALTSLISKIGSSYQFMSLEFILCYGLLIFMLGIYAVLWQQVLKRLKLSVAFANKGVTILWGMVFGVLFFGEAITIKKIICVLFIILGIVMIVGDEHE